MTEKYGILFGGRSTEHDASIHSFAAFLDQINGSQVHRRRFRAAVFVDRGGKLHWLTAEKLREPMKDYACVEEIRWSDFLELCAVEALYWFNLLHGNEGEDGCVQGLAEIVGIRGSFGGVFAASFTMSKWAQGFAAAALTNQAVQAPPTWIVDKHTTPDELSQTIEQIGGPFVLKPNAMGASLFTERFRRTQKKVAWQALQLLLRFDRQAILQAFIDGDEYTCGCLQEGDRVVALPIIHARTERNFLGHLEKHSRGKVQASFVTDENPVVRRIRTASEQLFRRIGLSNMARFDFIHHAKEDALYYLECNSIPGLGHGSAFPMMLEETGRSILDLIDVAIRNAKSDYFPCKSYAYAIEH